VGSRSACGAVVVNGQEHDVRRRPGSTRRSCVSSGTGVRVAGWRASKTDIDCAELVKLTLDQLLLPVHALEPLFAVRCSRFGKIAEGPAGSIAGPGFYRRRRLGFGW